MICVFSQYGEIVHVNLVRDLKTGKSKGFAFVCYQDQRSTILAVDNLNGMKLLGRLVRVDHVHTYKLPKVPDIDKYLKFTLSKVQQTFVIIVIESNLYTLEFQYKKCKYRI